MPFAAVNFQMPQMPIEPNHGWPGWHSCVIKSNPPPPSKKKTIKSYALHVVQLFERLSFVIIRAPHKLF